MNTLYSSLEEEVSNNCRVKICLIFTNIIHTRKLIKLYFLLSSFLISQIDYLEWYNHTELEWKTIETDQI